ncbi:hypothetical protein KGQ19_36710 [Catenulispora sp. NL8]|uniref:Carbamoyltransferase n=1 Tax=Catenulispora pinistramenti TaxID=2705254 RepID=A0ABS5L249_9ACTN|nr:hypothetical protein [Catenulispora pinistramenti]
MSTTILGVSAFFHDSAACLLKDGSVVAAAAEEAFTRRKHDPSFPSRAARWCLESEGLDWSDVDWFAYNELPALKRQRVADSESVVCGGPSVSGFSGHAVRPLPKTSQNVRALFPHARRGARVLAVEHHASHAASGFFPSPFDRAAIVTVDGVGEYTTTSISRGDGNTITPLRRQSFPHSLGLLYSAFTDYCGFRVNSGEYKLMGLAPYGTARYAQLIEDNLIRVLDDGAFRLNMDYFAFLDPSSDRMTNPAFEALLGRGRRPAESDIDDFYADVAASIQAVFEKAVVRMARHARRLTGSPNLCLAGGGALNCVANSKIYADGAFDEVWVQPAASDAGGALGAASYVWHQRLGNPRRPNGRDAMSGALLGPSFTDEAIRDYLESVGARYRRLDPEDVFRTVAEILDAGKIVAWFRGPMEFGPRALGNRSILGDPRQPHLQRHINLAVKQRESFRPFAPAVAAERCADYFDFEHASPYMLFVAPVRPDIRVAAGEADQAGGPLDRIHGVRSLLPAVTHVDYSARLQTVDRAVHPDFWRLIQAFGARTGVHCLVNTSFNVRGEPIVCTPEDALRTFLRTEIDYLCLGDFILDRHDQSQVDLIVPAITDTD